MEDHREWEKARQVVEAIAKIMLGDSAVDELTAENPVVETSTMTGSGAVRTETKIKRLLNVDYEKRVEELAADKIKVDAEGAGAVERLRQKWAKEKEQSNG